MSVRNVYSNQKIVIFWISRARTLKDRAQIIEHNFTTGSTSTQSCYVGKRKECIVNLCVLLSYLMQPYRENCYLQVLRNTVGLNSCLGLFALGKEFSWFAYEH